MFQYFGQCGAICRMIKIEHSIFALPYAWAGAFLAANGLPSWKILVFLTIAMVGIRSFAMTFNRIVDLKYDRLNPRTSGRPLGTGSISLWQAWLFSLVMCLVFIGACACLNSLCLMLSFPAILFVAIYSFLKRITPLCHFWLGASLGLAPLAGWLAVQPQFLGLAPLMLFFAVTFWVGAFDVYYSFQDVEFDRDYALHSIPADLGDQTAMSLAGFSHIMTVIFLLLTGLEARLSWPWYVFCLGVAILLLIEYKLVKPDDLRYVNMAFFTFNSIISPLVFVGIVLGIYF